MRAQYESSVNSGATAMAIATTAANPALAISATRPTRTDAPPAPGSSVRRVGRSLVSVISDSPLRAYERDSATLRARMRLVNAATRSLARVRARRSDLIVQDRNGADAAATGSNGLIAFQSDRDYPTGALSEIYVMQANGSGQTRLTLSGGAMPAWSYDGRKIAYSRNVGNGGQIWVMNALPGRHPH